MRFILLIAGLVLAGCVTTAPTNMSACQAEMAAMHQETGPAGAASSEVMKNCPMMKDKAAPAPPKEEGHGDGPEH